MAIVLPIILTGFSLLIFVLIFSFLVIIHELGHFLAAKWAKIKVDEFGLGYPPRALKLFRWWGTDFTLNWVPFGGFVRMWGEDGEESVVEENDTVTNAAAVKKTGSKSKSKKDSSSQEGPFYEKTVLQRLVVILAGASINILFGGLAFMVFFAFKGIPSGAMIATIQPNTPAEKSGLPTQVAIIGLELEQSGHTQRYAITGANQVIQFVGEHRGQSVTVITTGPCSESRCEETERKYLAYLRTAAETPPGEGALGISFNADYLKFYPWHQMPLRGIQAGLNETAHLVMGTGVALAGIVTKLFGQGQVPSDVMGPVGIGQVFVENKIALQGWLANVYFAAVVSVGLGIMNVLPIPALDGGRAFLIFLELLIGKARVQKIEPHINYGGFIFILALILLITSRDLYRVFME